MISSSSEELDKKLNFSKKKRKPGKSLLRHSSLGILPSSIAIGSGMLVDDTSYEDLARMRRESVSRNFPRFQNAVTSGTADDSSNFYKNLREKMSKKTSRPWTEKTNEGRVYHY